MELTHFVVEHKSADDIWCDAIETISLKYMINRLHDQSQSGRDQPTIELIQTMMYLTDPRERFVVSREIDLAFAFVELFWHLSGRDDLSFLDSWNSRMKNFSDGNIILHGAYGYRLRRWGDTFDQLQNAYLALKHNPDGRQIVLQIWDAVRDLPNQDGSPKSKDIPCNTQAYLKIRNGKLYWTQMMRSHDLIWGFPYDVIHWTTIQEIMAGWLNVDVGIYAHFSDSLHVYKRHWSFIEEFSGRVDHRYANFDDLRQPYDYSMMLISTCTNVITALSKCEDRGSVISVMKTFDNLEPSYRNILCVIAAERVLRIELKNKILMDGSLNIIRECKNKVYVDIWLKWRDYRVERLNENS